MFIKKTCEREVFVVQSSVAMMENRMKSEFTYDVIETISDSDKSAVFLASCGLSPEPVIVKVLKTGDPRIVSCIAGLDSPNIPQILHWEQEGEKITVVEEYIDGVPIDQYVRESHAEEQDVVGLILQIGEALRQLHAQEPPVIHRDLKPSNLIVSPDGVVRLIDFDASRVFKDNQERDTRTLGTTGYAPPEQYGYSQTDVRSDIYSLGVVLQELLSDNRSEGQDKNTINSAKLGLEREKKPSVSPALEQVIRRSTMFAPEARYQSIDEMMDALRHPRGNHSRFRIYIAAGVALLVLLVGGFFLWNMVSTNEPETEKDEVTLTTMDWRTETSVEAVYYYWSEYPERTPVTITTAKAKGLTAESIQVRNKDSISTDTLSSGDWSQDEYGFIHLSPSYLAGLSPDTVYTLVVDYGSLLMSFHVCSVDDLKKVEYGEPGLAPGYVEYLRTEPGDIYTSVTNSFGRKLLRLVDTETREELDPTYYEYDEEKQIVRFHQALFDNVPNDEYLNYFLVFDSLPEIEDPPMEKGPAITFHVRDRAYIRPELERTSFILSHNDSEDLEVSIEWNDGEGNLQYIAQSGETDGDSIHLAEDCYSVTDDGILFHKEYLQSLSPGEYQLFLEFGDVGSILHVTVR